MVPKSCEAAEAVALFAFAGALLNMKILGWGGVGDLYETLKQTSLHHMRVSSLAVLPCLVWVRIRAWIMASFIIIIAVSSMAIDDRADL